VGGPVSKTHFNPVSPYVQECITPDVVSVAPKDLRVGDLFAVVDRLFEGYVPGSCLRGGKWILAQLVQTDSRVHILVLPWNGKPTLTSMSEREFFGRSVAVWLVDR
jgi:hypothetical protein